MPTRLLVLCLLYGACLAATPFCRAQERTYPEGTVRIVLLGGESVVGRVVAEREAEVEVETQAGVRMTIPRAQIRSVVSLAGKRFARTDPNATRLLFAPTGRALGSRRGYLAVYEIFAPFAAVGVGDRVTLAGGITINPGDERLGYVAPKVTLYERPATSVAVGGIGGMVLGSGEGGGLLFGVGTFGRPERAVTVGLGVAFDDDARSDPLIVVGGELQLSDFVKLLSENYVVLGVEDAIVVSGGIRFFGDRLAADLALLTVPALVDDLEGFPFIPWLSFAYNF